MKEQDEVGARQSEDAIFQLIEPSEELTPFSRVTDARPLVNLVRGNVAIQNHDVSRFEPLENFFFGFPTVGGVNDRNEVRVDRLPEVAAEITTEELPEEIAFVLGKVQRRDAVPFSAKAF